jgi:cytochrome c-type biogenesis protein CcmE
MGKNIDKELAEAAGLGEDHAEEPNDDASMAVPQGLDDDEAQGKRSLGMLAALLVMVGVIVSLFLFGIDDVEVYSMTLEKFAANQQKYEGRRVRVEGELVPNSLKKRDSPCEYRFRLRDGDARLDVRFPQCVVPEAFVDRGQPGVMVTAEGKMNGDHFEASTIMAKCASKYDPETHTLEGQEQAQAPGAAAP